LRPAAGLWDSCHSFRTNLSAQMLRSSVIALILPWLLVAAATLSPRAPNTGPDGLGDARAAFTASLRQGSPLAALVRPMGASRSQLLRPGSHPADNDNVIGLGNAPAARIEGGDRVEPVLEPLGTLCRSRYALPSHRILSRRASRGPPVFS
jgi:hypothetical protein